MKKKLLFCFFSLIFFFQPVFALDSGDAAFVDGCRAYAEGDWTGAIFSLKKAASFEEKNTPETYFMLINAEIYSGDFRSALDDCEWYLNMFGTSLYEANVTYLKGRALYELGEYDKAVITLSDFCHQNEKHDMYAAALFWIGECFYACYQFDDAVSLYQRVVTEFSGDAKAPASQYRIETIRQRDREEKLLYLLKQTGEEYLFAREEYEKQLKLYSTETAASTRKKLQDAQQKNAELEEKFRQLENELETVKAQREAALNAAEAEAARAAAAVSAAEKETARANAAVSQAESEAARAESEAARAKSEAARAETEAQRAATEAARAAAALNQAEAEAARADAIVAEKRREEEKKREEEKRLLQELRQKAAETKFLLDSQKNSEGKN